jgi:hypothetical protein
VETVLTLWLKLWWGSLLILKPNGLRGYLPRFINQESRCSDGCQRNSVHLFDLNFG